MTISFDADLLGPWVCQEPKRKWISGTASAIGKVKNGSPLVAVLYEDFTGTSVTMHIRGDDGWADRGFLWMMFHYPFVQLGCKRITAPISEANKKCIKLVENMGLTLECRLSQATPEGDLLIYRLFKEDCRFLGDRYAKHSPFSAWHS